MIDVDNLELVVFYACCSFCPSRPVKEDLPDVLNSRSNVFDDDEFDIFRREQVDMSRIWKGRR